MRKALFLFLSFLFLVIVIPSPIGHAEDNETANQAVPFDFSFGDAHFTESDTVYEMSEGSEHTVSNLDSSADEHISNPALAVSGDFVWRIADGMILCEDVKTGEEEAAYPVALLLQPGESAVFASVISQAGESVRLCLCVRKENNSICAELMDLRLEDNAITAGNRCDVTSVLGFLFDGSTEWSEITMTSSSHQVLVEAMDSDFSIHLYLYDPETASITSLDEWSPLLYRAAIPCDENVLLVMANIEESNLLDIYSISSDSNEAEYLSSVSIDSAADAANFAWNEEEQQLYFTINSAAYQSSLQSNETPEVIGAFSAVPILLRNGAIAGEYYVVWGEGSNAEGELLSCNIHDRIDVINLRIADSFGEEAISEAALSFGVNHPGYTVSVIDNQSEEDIASILEKGSSEYDLFVLTLNSDTYKDILSSGNLVDLSTSDLLLSAAEDMPHSIRSALISDGKLLSFPLSVTTYCQTLNVSAVSELCGLSRDKVPTDWVGLLKLLRQISSKGLLINNTEYSLYGQDYSAEEFRATMLNWLLQDTYLWLTQDPARVEKLQSTLTPVLTAFNKVDWYHLGLTEAPDEEEYDDEFAFTVTPGVNNIYLLMDSSPEIAVMDFAPGEEFWPLSIGNDERLVSQSVTVLCLNPYSENLDMALCFAEAVWEHADATTKATLSMSETEPVLNENYEDDLDYLEELAASYEKDLDATEDAMEKALISSELNDLRDFIEDYRENGTWLITEDSIALYRSLTEHSVLIADTDWGMEDEDALSWQFLDGVLSPKQYTKQLASSLQSS